MNKRFKDYINKKAILKSGLFDKKYYLSTYPDVEKSNLDPLTHYLQIGAKEGKNPSKEFDTKYYLKNNPDVKEIGINPLVHFLRYGAKEGRNPNNLFSTEELVAKGILQLSRDSLLFLYLKRIIKKIKKLPVNIENHIVEGMKKYDKYKDTILLISHESSSTGAPLLGLNIGKGLCSKYNLIHLVIRKSNIHNEFLNDSFITIENINIGDTLLIKKILENMNEKYQIKCVIGNSIVTYPILQLSKDLNIATLSLVHEFSEYTKPSSRIINNIIVADRVIYPAKIVIDSTQSTIEELTSIRDIPKNINYQNSTKY